MNLFHITKSGERWDTIAWNYYGDVRQVAALMAANPHAPASPVLPSGLRLVVPMREQDVANNPDGVPPWRR